MNKKKITEKNATILVVVVLVVVVSTLYFLFNPPDYSEPKKYNYFPKSIPDPNLASIKSEVTVQRDRAYWKVSGLEALRMCHRKQILGSAKKLEEAIKHCKPEEIYPKLTSVEVYKYVAQEILGECQIGNYAHADILVTCIGKHGVPMNKISANLTRGVVLSYVYLELYGSSLATKSQVLRLPAKKTGTYQPNDNKYSFKPLPPFSKVVYVTASAKKKLTKTFNTDSKLTSLKRGDNELPNTLESSPPEQNQLEINEEVISPEIKEQPSMAQPEPILPEFQPVLNKTDYEAQTAGPTPMAPEIETPSEYKEDNPPSIVCLEKPPSKDQKDPILNNILNLNSDQSQSCAYTLSNIFPFLTPEAVKNKAEPQGPQTRLNKNEGLHINLRPPEVRTGGLVFI